MKWHNYFVTGKHSRLTQGHLPAAKLYDKILNHNGDTAFCCYFDLDYNHLKLEVWHGKYDADNKKIYSYINQTGEIPKTSYKPEITFTQYEGPARPALNMVSFDFDSEDPQTSLEDVRKFVEWLDVEDLAIFFSGSKGFHVMVPFGYFGLTPSAELPQKLKDLAKHLKKFFPTLDDSIYNYNRKFRVPFSRHDKSGLFKNYIHVEAIDLSMTAIIDNSAVIDNFDFLKTINSPETRDTLPVIEDALTESARASYEIDKTSGGSLVIPTNFEKYDKKVCIQKMLAQRCDDIGRNNAALRIVNDFYRTGKFKVDCERELQTWSSSNGLAWAEIQTIINNIYEHSSNYNFGCQDECKSSYCSYKCDIYKKLDPDKRPAVVDMPETAFKDQEKAKKPSQFTVVKRVLKEIFKCEWNEQYKKFERGIILKQGEKDLFLYRAGHWQLLEDEQLSSVKIKFNGMFEQTLTTRDIDNIWKMFLMYVPNRPPGVDMFYPLNNVANFNNGTLHLITNHSGESKLEFKDHNKADYVTFKIDFDYPDNFEKRSEYFESWLINVLDGDEEKFNLVQEMYGAALLPTFPQFFILIGKSDAGKTTAIKVLQHLLGNNPKNISKVAPHQFHGFHMASMVGKLVNIVTDIRTDVAISDDIVKQVEDRDIMRIERKRKDDLYAPLPALHIYGANEMPKTKETTSGAMIKRFKILRFNKPFKGKKNREIAKKLFYSSPEGILNFALAGLFRIVNDNGGFFSNSSESAEEVRVWSNKEDLIQFFLEEAMVEGVDFSGDMIMLERAEEGRIKRRELWDYFSMWQENSITNFKKVGKIYFFDHLSKLGFDLKTVNGHFYFYGMRRVNEGAKEAGCKVNENV